MKAWQDKQIKDRKEEDERRLRHDNLLQDNKNFLRKQMEDKRAQANLERMQDKAFADVLTRQLQENQKKDQANAMKKRDAANDYIT